MHEITPISLASQSQDNEIILYQPDSTIKLEVRLESETVWLTQQQIADLFGTKRPAIKNILPISINPVNWRRGAHVPFWNIWVTMALNATLRSIITSMLFYR